MLGELFGIATNEAPLLVDTVAVTEEGLYSLDPVEHAMLEDVVRDLGSRGETLAQNSVSDTTETDNASGAYTGCRDVESLTSLHQILPYGSQFRDTTSSAGHAWVNADIREDEQMRRAVEQVEAAIQRHSGTQPLVLSAYSDGSVTGRGVTGSAAIVIETPDGEVVATVWLAPTDMALMSGRAEWVGLVMVLRATRPASSCVWATSRSPARSTTDDASTFATGSSAPTAMRRPWRGLWRRNGSAGVRRSGGYSHRSARR